MPAALVLRHYQLAAQIATFWSNSGTVGSILSPPRGAGLRSGASPAPRRARRPTTPNANRPAVERAIEPPEVLAGGPRARCKREPDRPASRDVIGPKPAPDDSTAGSS
jgi:hypothetical protein